MKLLVIVLFSLMASCNICVARNKLDKIDKFLSRNFCFFTDLGFYGMVNFKNKVVIRRIPHKDELVQYEFEYWTKSLKFYTDEKSNFDMMDFDDLSIIKGHNCSWSRKSKENEILLYAQKFEDYYKDGIKYRLYSVFYNNHQIMIMFKIVDNKIIRVGYLMTVS